MARVGSHAGFVGLALVLFLGGAPHPSVARASEVRLAFTLVADRDDDDLNGVPDGDEPFVAPAGRVDVVPIDDALVGSTLRPSDGADHARVLVGGRPLPWGERVPRGAAFQGVTPGVVNVVAERAGERHTFQLVVLGLGFIDGADHHVDLTRSHASLDREPPSDIPPDHPAEDATPYAATDPLRVFLTAITGPYPVTIDSFSATGALLDTLSPHGFVEVTCRQADPLLHCFVSAPIRFVIDDVDRRHILAARRSIRAELGGAVVLRLDGLGRKQTIRVLGPRESPVGPIGRLRATIRPFVLRIAPGGAPAIGGNDAGAVAAFRAELASAAAAWGECGVSFGPIDEVTVNVVDPPPPHLLAVGNDLGLPASGGRVRFRIDGQKLVDVATRVGQLPDDVAREAARVIERAGFTAVVSPNAAVGSGANPSVDVSVRHRNGTLARLERVDLGTPVSSDPTLAVRIGAVDLADGLSHFGDVDSVAGTLEERTMLKALDDGDPSTIEVVVVPFFAGGGRIGESFIGSDRSSLRNIVLLDRAGVRARTSSLTLAHELGHVFLDVPGHPDDYGVDTPTRLMDADASDASPFGPRRLTLGECARVVRESGPRARSPLLREWPVTAMVYAKGATR
jgi:hypothetical protein